LVLTGDLDIYGEGDYNGLANNKIKGNPGNNRLSGRGGDDTLNGGAGNDTLEGGANTDRLVGGVGDDLLDGGEGYSDDVDFTSSSGPVVIDLTAGTATGEGNDTLVSIEDVYASRYDDTVIADSQTNFIYGLEGNDLLRGLGNTDRLNGGAGNDTLEGGEGDNDSLSGGFGDDLLDGGPGSIDTADYSTAVGPVTVNFGTGIVIGEGRDTLVDMEGVIGSSYNDRLIGDSAVNYMAGLAGNDIFIVSDGDRILEQPDEGFDTVRASVSWTLGENFEQLVLLGSQAINATGNSAANMMSGNAASNVLSGLLGFDRLRGFAGNDVLRGGAGNDTLTGGTGEDGFVFDTALNAMTNLDKVTDFMPSSDSIRLDDDVFKTLSRQSRNHTG
jgi:Ca2+-binding RTX toxin-like protein